MWANCLVLRRGPAGFPDARRRSITGLRLQYYRKKLFAHCGPRRRETGIGPSHRNKLPNVASQMRVAFASMALKTGSSLPGELLMTLSTSAVAASRLPSLRRAPG